MDALPGLGSRIVGELEANLAPAQHIADVNRIRRRYIIERRTQSGQIKLQEVLPTKEFHLVHKSIYKHKIRALLPRAALASLHLLKRQRSQTGFHIPLTLLNAIGLALLHL